MIPVPSLTDSWKGGKEIGRRRERDIALHKWSPALWSHRGSDIFWFQWEEKHVKRTMYLVICGYDKQVLNLSCLLEF